MSSKNYGGSHTPLPWPPRLGDLLLDIYAHLMHRRMPSLCYVCVF